MNTKIKLNMDSLKSGREWVRHKIKSGHNVYRILPPFGDNSNGYPYKKWQLIWGLADPKTGRVHPYASSLMTDKRCPVAEYVAQLNERLGKMESELRAAGLDDKALTKHPKYARLSKFTRDITPKTVYLYNAADKSGAVGLLELKSTAHKSMKTKMNEYIQDYNQDPTSLSSADDDSGVWFDVVRAGEGFKTEYKVEKCQKKEKDPNGRVTFVDDRSPLADVVVENYQNLGYDLSSIYPLNSYDDMNEVFQANLDKFYEVCPEANLSVEVNLSDDEVEEEYVAPAPVAKKPMLTGSKVALLVDEDDDQPIKVAAKAPLAKVVADVDEDDFMREADELLKG
jgi:hypothetical protein